MADESEHDRQLIAIALLFVRLQCDCFKPRRRLEADILVLRHQLKRHDIIEQDYRSTFSLVFTFDNAVETNSIGLKLNGLRNWRPALQLLRN